MKTRAAVAWEAGKPLQIEEIDIDGPKNGEVLLRNVATGVCHTDAFTLSGEDPEGIFPAVLGHEGGAIVEEVGAGEGTVGVAWPDHRCRYGPALPRSARFRRFASVFRPARRRSAPGPRARPCPFRAR